MEASEHEAAQDPNTKLGRKMTKHESSWQTYFRASCSIQHTMSWRHPRSTVSDTLKTRLLSFTRADRASLQDRDRRCRILRVRHRCSRGCCVAFLQPPIDVRRCVGSCKKLPPADNVPWSLRLLQVLSNITSAQVSAFSPDSSRRLCWWFGARDAH